MIITIGKPPKKKQTVVPIDTATATSGEKNMAMKIVTWLASVNEAGSIMILNGVSIGMIMPIATNSPAKDSLKVGFVLMLPD